MKSTTNSNEDSVYPKQASAFRKGELIMIDGLACKIMEMTKVKPGKHGVAKCQFVAIEIFNNSKKLLSASSKSNVDAPVTSRSEWIFLGMDSEDYMSLLDENTGETRQDLKLPANQLGKQIKDLYYPEQNPVRITLYEVAGMEKVDGVKLDTM
eukprot:m.50900 g.50900  ORF g.50900 m.50900 type:complete len:153 (-) comp21361_c0_seq1:283-741(-)